VKALDGFDWDEHNVGHIAEHGIDPFEVESATNRPHVVFPSAAKGDEPRWKLFGRTSEGRYLVVVYTIRAHRFRAVTAYPMNRMERKRYASQIDV